MMNEETNKLNNSFDAAIKNKLYDHEVAPSRNLWANIEEGLHTDAPIQKNKDNSRYFLLLLAFISLIGISATSSYYILNNQHKKSTISTASVNAQQFAINYNQVNGGIANSSNANTTGNASANTSKEKFAISHVYVGSDNTKHIFLTKLQDEKIGIANLAVENRISNYKEVPVMYMSAIAAAASSLAFNGINKEEDPIFVSSKPNNKGFYVGAKVQSGVNLMSKNNVENKMLGTNLQFAPAAYYKAGVVLGYNVSNKVCVQSGLNYISNNINYSSNVYDAVGNGQLKLSYVELPVIVKYKMNFSSPKGMNSSVNVYGGMSYAYLVRAAADMNNKKLVHYSNQNYNAKEYLPNHQLNVIAGAEYQVYLKKNIAWSVGVEANYGGGAKELRNWTRTNSNAFNNMGIGVNTIITFSTKKAIK